MIWEYKHTFITVKNETDLPGERLHLIIARNVLDPDDIKFFVSNAPPATGIGTLLLVAFSRWRVERCFEDDKCEIGLDQYEGRRYLGLKRRLVLSAVSYLFLAKVRQKWGGNRELTVCQLHTATVALIRSWWDNNQPASDRLLEKTAAKITYQQQRNAQARNCHTKTTKRRLHELGIRLTDVPRCSWGRT